MIENSAIIKRNHSSAGFEQPFLMDLPAHWKFGRISYKYEVQLGKMLQPEPRDVNDELKPYLRSANVHWDGVDLHSVKEMWLNKKELTKYRLHPHDVLVSEGGDVGRSSYWLHDHEMYIQNAILRLRPVNMNDSLPRFLYYWLFFLKTNGFIDLVCNSATIAHYTAEKVKATYLVYPPVDEQRRVVKFLDQKTSQIDRLIKKKQKLLALLEEKRTAMITKAVTKGLRPGVPMKDSGIDWLGEIPVHWERCPVKHKTTFIGSGKTPKGGSEVYVKEGITLLRSMNVYDHGLKMKNVVFVTEEMDQNQRSTRLKEHDVLLNITGASIGRSFFVKKEILPANVNQHVCILRPDSSKVDFRFLHLLLTSKLAKSQIDSQQVGSSREGLNFKQVGTLEFPFPSLQEQREIADWVTMKTSQIQQSMKSIIKSIKLLQEYRSAIITNAVTGKLHRELV